MNRRSRPYRESLLEDLTDPDEAVLYLNAAKEDSLEMYLVALKDVAQAHQMAKVAKGSGVKRETLYRSFSEQGNPTIGTLVSVFEFLGLDFDMKRREKSEDIATRIDNGPDDANAQTEQENTFGQSLSGNWNQIRAAQMTSHEQIMELAKFGPAINNVAASGGSTWQNQ